MKVIKKLTLLTAIMVCFLFFSACANENEKSEFKKYKTMAEALNEQCPTKIEDDIQIDAVKYTESSHTLQYVYSFTKRVKENNTPEEWNMIAAGTREALITEFKSQTYVEQFRKDKLNMSFVYNDKNKELLFTIVLNSGEY